MPKYFMHATSPKTRVKLQVFNKIIGHHEPNVFDLWMLKCMLWSFQEKVDNFLLNLKMIHTPTPLLLIITPKRDYTN